MPTRRRTGRASNCSFQFHVSHRGARNILIPSKLSTVLLVIILRSTPQE